MTLLSAQEDDTKQRLGMRDWLSVALDVLIENGVEGIQITALSRRLGVTRGSFYWHFESREALLDALLAEWRARNTDVMVHAIAETQSLDDGILALYCGLDRPQLVLTRALIRQSAIGHDGRMHCAPRCKPKMTPASPPLPVFFERHGFAPTEAFIRARVIYFTQLSYYALNIRIRKARPNGLAICRPIS